jgi:hypothetical protein
MACDRQVIVQLGFDSTITTNAGRLNSSATIPSRIVEVHPGTGSGLAVFRYSDVRMLTSAFSNLTTNSRVYLQGHGDWINQRLENYNAEAMALLLASAKMPSVRIVSVLGCSLARDLNMAVAPNAVGDARLSNSVNSFAASLHGALKRRGITSDVYARVFDVTIVPTGSKNTFADDVDDNSITHKLPHSKVRFYWTGNTQVRAWAY